MNVKSIYKKFLKFKIKIKIYIKEKKRKNKYFFFEVHVYLIGSFSIILFVLKVTRWIS